LPGADRVAEAAIVYNPRCVDPHFLPIVVCPRCQRAGGMSGTKALRCSCGFALEPTDGYVDLLGATGQGEPTQTTSEQRLMESPVVARLYERVWRPTFVRVLAGRGAGAAVGGTSGEFFIHKGALALDGAAAAARSVVWPGAVHPGPGRGRARRAGGRPRHLARHARGRGRAQPRLRQRGAGPRRRPRPAVRRRQLRRRQQRRRAPRLRRRRAGAPRGPARAAPRRASSSAPRSRRRRRLVGRVTARLAGIRRYEVTGELRAQLARLGFAEYEELRLGGAFVFRARRP
jgi:hypothetical protein